jgi:hypothetical protein
MKKMKRYDGEEGSMVEGDASVAEQMEKMPAKAEPKAAPENRIVTKEELEASGLSLRDFLNRERGLTRRGESAPKSTPKTESITKTTVKTETPAPKAEEPAKTKRGIGPYNVFAGPDEPDAKAVQAAKAAGEARRAKIAAEPMFYNPFRGAIDVIRERGKKQNPEAYAKGGSVSSASKRADGIAQRGKTRGKMC